MDVMYAPKALCVPADMQASSHAALVGVYAVGLNKVWCLKAHTSRMTCSNKTQDTDKEWQDVISVLKAVLAGRRQTTTMDR